MQVHKSACSYASRPYPPQVWSKVLKHDTWSPWRRARLLVVGEGRAGKTTLLHALRDLPFVNTDSTAGIATDTLEMTALRNWVELKGTEGDKVTTHVSSALICAAKHMLTQIGNRLLLG